MKKEIDEIWERYRDFNVDLNKEVEFGSTQSLLPIAMKVVAQTIGKDLVSVQPMKAGISQEKMDQIVGEVKSENRERKIDSIVEGGEYQEMKVEEHPEYSHVSNFYLDYITLHDSCIYSSDSKDIDNISPGDPISPE
jgi:hypothetical protein